MERDLSIDDVVLPHDLLLLQLLGQVTECDVVTTPAVVMMVVVVQTHAKVTMRGV